MMKNDEAKEYLLNSYLVVNSPLNPSKEKCQRHNEVMDMAIQALEKQIPKIPNYEGDGYDPDGNLVYDTWICPCCEHKFEVEYEEYKHCPECGQKIDWGE